MVYPANFHKIVMIGNLYADTFNVTLSMIPAGGTPIGPATQALANSVGTVIKDWWDNPLATNPGNGLTISANAVLTSVKVNRIGPDGRYVDPDTREYILAPALPGGGSSGMIPQTSLVVTLRGANERGLAGKGRMYFPPSAAAAPPLATDGRTTPALALQHAYGVRTLMYQLNDAYLATGFAAVAGIASKSGAGAFQGLSKISVGRVVDTMRSRRNKQLEAPEEITV
jgi:hypothetical protein